MRPYILGLNNPRGNSALDPTETGSAGQRLWRMVHDVCDIRVDEWIARTQRVNLLDTRKLPRDYRRLAAIRGAYLGPLIRSRTVVLLGGDVSEAVGHATAPFVWSGTWVAVPHPSGKNLFYNDSAHRVALGTLLADLLGSSAGPADAVE